MIFLHLCNRPDVTVVQNQLLKFFHVREGGRTLVDGDHDNGHSGDLDDSHVGDRDDGVNVWEGGVGGVGGRARGGVGARDDGFQGELSQDCEYLPD